MKTVKLAVITGDRISITHLLSGRIFVYITAIYKKSAYDSLLLIVGLFIPFNRVYAVELQCTQGRTSDRIPRGAYSVRDLGLPRNVSEIDTVS